MARQHNASRLQTRLGIAQLAARLMAEDGIRDFALAKRKAARQLGVLEDRLLPNNAEIAEALRAYQSLFQANEQVERLQFLRHEALAAMRLLDRFDPRLTGPVLNGTAARYAIINLQLFPDDPKEVELFLLNRQLGYKPGQKRFRFGHGFRHVPVFLLTDGPVEIELSVFTAADLRQPPKDAVDGRSMERLRIDQVEMLLAGNAPLAG